MVMDRKTHTFADFNKVHTIDFDGKYFKSRGPLNTVPSPQHRPTFLQAGASPKGRQFAAGAADAIIAVGTGVEGMKEYRDDIRARAKPPAAIPMTSNFSSSSHRRSRRPKPKPARRWPDSRPPPNFEEKALVGISSNTEIDFKQFDLDEPLPADLTTNGERGSLEHFMRGNGAPGPKTLRELVHERTTRGLELVGTADQVAEKMGEAMEEIGGDGFLISRGGGRDLSREYITEVCDGLVPALQRRGLMRTEYTTSTLRETLREF